MSKPLFAALDGRGDAHRPGTGTGWRRRLRQRRPEPRRAGTWSASLEWLVERLAPELPQLGFAEVRYRIKSWNRLDLCVEDTLAALDEPSRRRPARARARLLDGRRGRDRRGGHPAVTTRARPGAVDPRAARPLGRSTAGGSSSSTARSTAGLPGIPGVSPASSRRGLRAGPGARRRGKLRADPAARLHAIARARALGRGRARSRAPAAGPSSSAASSRAFRRRARLKRAAAPSARGVGRLTFQTSPSRSRPRMSSHERSSCQRSSPWRAEPGKAWWLLCQPSPRTSSGDQPVVAASSRESVVLAPEHVADRVHAEGGVLVQEDAERGRPRPSPRPRARRAADEVAEGERDSEREDDPEDVEAVDRPHEPVLVEVLPVLAAPLHALQREEPADVGVDEAADCPPDARRRGRRAASAGRPPCPRAHGACGDR